MTVVEADVHRVDITNARFSRRFHSLTNSSPPPPGKTSHRWTTTTNSRCSPRHSTLSDLRDGDINTRNCGLYIGRTSSNVETRSSAKAETSALQSRRVHSCEYDGLTVTPVAERLRQLPRVRSPWTASRTKPTVVLLPPPPQRPASDKVPRYNDTGSFEEVDERFLMLEGFRNDRCRNSVPAAGSGQQRGANVLTSPAGSRSSSALQNVVGAQYRKLWDLRATLEQSGDLSDDGQSELSTSAAGRQRDAAGEKSQSSRERPAIAAPSFLPLPSEMRRQTYQHLAVERRLRQPAAASSGGPPGASVDSVEAPETDGDASDTSRYDLTTTSFESSTTTTTTTTDNNTDAGDGRLCPPSSSMRSPWLSALARVDAGSQEGKGPEVTDADDQSRTPATFVDTSHSSLFVRRSCSDISDLVEPQGTRDELDAEETTETEPGVAASLRSAARKRRDFRNERMSIHRLALDYDDIHSSTDQPSGDSVDGGGLASPSGMTSTAAAATTLGDPTHVARCGPSSALRRLLSYQLSSHSTAAHNLRCRHTESRDYRLVTSS